MKKETIEELREAGLSYKKIGEIFGVSRQCVEQKLHRERVLEYKHTRERLDYARNYYLKNKAFYQNYQKEYRKKNADKFKEYSNKYKKRKKES